MKKKLQTYLQWTKQYIHFRHKNLKYRYVTIKIHSTISKLEKVRLKMALKSMQVWNIANLSPSVILVLNVDDASKIPPDDLRLYAPCDFKETKFWMYVGAIPWIALNANNKILKWMRCFNGSQCSSYISGVIWLKRGAQQANLVAVLKTRWTMLSCEAGRPYKRLLQ